MDKLPSEITTDILLRLPINSIIQCKLVCKTWRTLLAHPYFADKHLRCLHDRNAAAGNVSLLFCSSSNDRLYYGEYDKNDDEYRIKLRPTRINFQAPVDMARVVGSCNGLICISISTSYRDNDPVYICNPITGESMNLPRFDSNTIEGESSYKGRIMSGFGYHSSTNEYKVVRIFYPKNQLSVGQAQVYTLGSSSGWRNKGEITYSWPTTLSYSIGTLANGALHWVDKGGNILAFDLTDESFRLLPSPPSFPSYFRYEIRNTPVRLGEMGGWLSVFYDKNDGSAELWSLKGMKNSSTSNTEQQGYCHFWSLNTGLSIKIDGSGLSEDYDYYRQTALMTKSGEVLLYDGTMFSRTGLARLFRCEPKTATMKNFVDMDFGEDSFSFYVIPDHVNTFVSLNAL